MNKHIVNIVTLKLCDLIMLIALQENNNCMVHWTISEFYHYARR